MLYSSCTYTFEYLEYTLTFPDNDYSEVDNVYNNREDSLDFNGVNLLNGDTTLALSSVCIND